MGECVVIERVPGIRYREVIGRQFTAFASSFSHNSPLWTKALTHIEKYSLWSKCVNNRHEIRSEDSLSSLVLPPLSVLNALGRRYTFHSGSVCLRLKYPVPCKLGITHLCETVNTSYRFLAGRDLITKGR